MAAPDSYGYIHVNFGVMEQGGQDLAAVHQTLVSTLEQLQSDMVGPNGLLKDWSSQARDAFNAHAAIWQAKADDMARSLANFSNFVTQANDHYINTEATNTGIWM